MQTMQVNSIGYILTSDGRLKHPEGWNEDVAEALAVAEGLSLTDEHWDVIRSMRAYYQEYNISPIRKLLKKDLAGQFGPERASDECLQTLFPNDVLIQGTRIAGLPIPLLDTELVRTYRSTEKKPVVPKATEVHAVIPVQHTQELEFEEKLIKLHPNGNLVNMNDWSESLANFLADREGIALTDGHWEVIHFLREFYFEYGITPMVRLLMKHMRDKVGAEKGSRDYLYGLFPEGPSRQGSRIAGLPEPQGCIDP